MLKGSLCSLTDEDQVWARPPATQAPKGTAITTIITTEAVVNLFKESTMMVTTKIMMVTVTVTLLCSITQA